MRQSILNSFKSPSPQNPRLWTRYFLIKGVHRVKKNAAKSTDHERSHVHCSTQYQGSLPLHVQTVCIFWQSVFFGSRPYSVYVVRKVRTGTLQQLLYLTNAAAARARNAHAQLCNASMKRRQRRLSRGAAPPATVPSARAAPACCSGSGRSSSR